MNPEAPHTLYRFWEGGNLLYIGISINAYTRTKGHQSTAGWWPEATSVTFEKYPNRAAVLVAEREAIRAEQPKYNVQGYETTKKFKGRSTEQIEAGAAHLRHMTLAFSYLTPEEEDEMKVKLDSIAKQAREHVIDPSVALGQVCHVGDAYYEIAKARMEKAA